MKRALGIAMIPAWIALWLFAPELVTGFVAAVISGFAVGHVAAKLVINA